MSIDINTTPDIDVKDHFEHGSLLSTVVGTGVDVAVVSRVALTPFFSLTRSFLGDPTHTRCVNVVQTDGSQAWQCYQLTSEPGSFNLKQLGVRIGWR